MAPVQESTYLPPLEPCLRGQAYLSSWKETFETLQDACIDPNAPIPSFLQEAQVLELLQADFSAQFKKPSAASRSIVETLTSAVNVTPSTNGGYDISNIKEDTQWLSKEADIDEVAALRITLLEWQNRSKLRLEENARRRGPYNQQEDSVISGVAIQSDADDDNQASAAFNGEGQRRRRILEQFLSERTALLRCCTLLLGTSLLDSSPIASKDTIAPPTELRKIGDILVSHLCPGNDRDAAIKRSVGALRSYANSLEKGCQYSGFEDPDQSVDSRFYEATLIGISECLKVVFLVTSTSDRVATSESVLGIFTFLDECGLFASLQPIEARHEVLIENLQSSVAIVCMTLLQVNDLPKCIDLHLARYAPSAPRPEARAYLNDPQCVEKIHSMILAHAERGAGLLTPATFLWVFVLDTIKEACDQSRRASGDLPINVYQDSAHRIFGDSGDDDIRLSLAAATVDHSDVFGLLSRVGAVLCRAYSGSSNARLETQVRLSLLEFVGVARNLVQYGTEIFGLLLFTLTGTKTHRSLSDDIRSGQSDPVAQYDFTHEKIAQAFALEAQARFPYEAAPFLQLSRVLALTYSPPSGTAIIPIGLLERSDYFTQRLPPNFSHFHQLEAGTNDSSDFRLRLTYDLPLFTSRRPRRLALTSGREENEVALQSNPSQELDSIPADTVGVVADDESRPLVVTWNFAYSPLQYLIFKLATQLPGSTHVDYASNDDTDPIEVADVIALLAAHIELLPIRAATDGPDSQSEMTDILDNLSSQVMPGKDLISMVSEIFEARLQQIRQTTNAEESMEVLVRCLQFFHAVALRSPGRLWSTFARSQLLGLGGEEGILDIVVSAPEMINGRLEFVLGTLDVFNALMEASFDDLTAKPSKKLHLTRFGSAAASDYATPVSPAKLKAAVLLAFLKPLIGVFHASHALRYSSIQDQTDLRAGLASTFSTILNQTYGVGDAPLLKDKITGVLSECAELLMELLLSTSPTRGLATAVIHMLSSSQTSPGTATIAGEQKTADRGIKAALDLSSTALRLSAFLGRPVPVLQQQVFAAAPHLAVLFATHDRQKTSIATLLTTLLETASAQSDSQPPSLLGHMGPLVAKEFLAIVTQSKQPAVDAQTEIAVWNLLSAVVSSRQQWFAIFLLTGNAPKDRRKSGKTDDRTKVQGKSIFTYALGELSTLPTTVHERTLSTAENERTLAILRFVASCQNGWPWALAEMRQKHNTGFIDGVSDYLMKLKRDSDTSDAALYVQTSIAGYTAEILAMYLHSARQLDDRTVVPRIARKLAYLRNYGVANPRFNANHQSHLARNFATLYPTLKLTDLKHTVMAAPQYGKNYFYDVDLATKLLRNGKQGVAQQRDILLELERANENFSAIDAQLTLIKRWRTLALELVRSLPTSADSDRTALLELLADVARECLVLQVDTSAPLPSASIQDSLIRQRLELAQIILQDLVRVPAADAYLKDIFTLSWEAVRRHQEDFHTAFASAGAATYRLLLQILFLAITPLKRRASQPRPADSLRMSTMAVSRTEKPDRQLQQFGEANDLLEVLFQVVSKGFRSLASLVHEDPGACSPSDFVLITAIMQSILSIPGIELMQSQIALEFASSNTTRCATSLFSWANQLTVNNDPVYGELAILYLLELSTLPAIAEQLAVEGVLAQLSTANLLQYYTRPNGMGPFDKPARLHSIWARGILPLCLNLVDAVGPPVAAEVAAFLNEFPNQIKRLGSALANRNGAIGARPSEVHFTLSMASELHTLSLISLLLDRYRAAGASTGSLVQDIPALEWDKATIAQDLEDWLQGRSLLSDAIMPASERDAEMAKQKAVGNGVNYENRLIERVVEEFKAALECLSANGGST